MKKFFQNQAVAWIVLILAVVLACLWGLSRKDTYESKQATELLEVKYGTWVNDSARMLSDATEKTVEEYNTEWSAKYGGLVAVASVPTLNGWSNSDNKGGQDYGAAMGQKWGLGAYDMLLLLVKDEYWYAVTGDSVSEVMNQSMQNRLSTAMDTPYYKGNFDEAVVAFFRQADVFYAQASRTWANAGTAAHDNTTEWDMSYSQPAKAGHVSIFKVILLIIAIFVVWAILDRVRYSRYRRRTVVHVGTAPAVGYYPIFWGRPSRAAVSAAPPPHHTGVYHSPSHPPRPSGTYYAQKPSIQKPGAARPANRPATPARPANTAKPNNSARPGGFGKSGFGGGKR